ncbi:MAG: hypothetical protein KDH15_21690 [Rhodocyclaceae bacterium]|nr:hypothetical protein [Rhodocyclaceae bacterium]
MLPKIPPEGLSGDALREARAADFRQVITLVMTALAEQRAIDAFPEAFYADRVVIHKAGRYYAVPYTVGDDNTVSFGEEVEVVGDHKPVALREAALLEAVGEADAGRWLIRVIRAGRSGNGNYYPDAVLREAVPLVNGTRVFVKGDAEHLKGGGKDVRNLIGGLSNARFVEGASADTGEIQAELTLIRPDGDTAVQLREAYARGLSNLLGFSIDCSGTTKTELREGRKVRVAKHIRKVSSVDLIVEPGAGGELIRFLEAQAPDHDPQEDADVALRERLIEAIKAKRPDYTGNNVSDEQLEAAYREAVAPPPAQPQHDDDSATAVRLVECRLIAREQIAAAKLPQPAKDKLLARFAEAKEIFERADVDRAIEDERAYLARFTEAGKPVIPFDEAPTVEDRSAKIAGMLDAFFDPAHKEHRAVGSFRECYVEITGDRYISGRLRDCDQGRLAESLGVFREALTSASWADALGDSITRRMQQVYQGETDLQSWRRIARVTRANDFRAQERFRIGGYGNLPAVAEGGPYTALASPGDDKATYAVSKRGGTETVTIEMIANDDVGAIRQIPVELALAAGHTLYEFAFDFFRTNPTIWDGVALYHASHANLFTAALDAAAISAHRLAMSQQVRAGSGKRMGLQPKVWLGPSELQETAYNLFVRATNNDKTFVQALDYDLIVVPYWTDANDWCLVADPMRLAALEIAFLNGQEEPELFVQDMPNVGSIFSNDQITYKIRHIYGGVVPVDGEKATTKAVVL